jgi:alpha-1,6-mannosyltransferase
VSHMRILGVVGALCVLGASTAAAALGDLREAPLASVIALSAAVLGAALAMRAAVGLPATLWLVAALVARAILSVGAPTLSDDEHRYIHEGRAQRQGLATPYRVPPAAFVPAPDDGTTARVNHPDVPAAYPPGTELWLLATVALGDAIGAPRAPLRVSLLLADVLVLFTLFRRRKSQPLAFIAYGMHPLPLLEIALSRHVDALGMAFLFFAVLLAARPGWAGALAGLAMHVKPIGALALLGVQGGARMRAAVTALVVAVVLALPHAAAGAPLLSGIFQYATRWRAAPIVYAALEAPMQPFFEERAARGVYAHAHVQLSPLALLVEDAGRPLVSIGTPGARAMKVLLDHALLARMLAGILLGVAVLVIARATWSHAARVGAALGATWLLVPTLHPWYLLWVVPIAALTGSRALWAFSAFSPVLYQPVFHAAAGGPWDEALWPRVLLVAATAAGAALDWRSRRA